MLRARRSSRSRLAGSSERAQERLRRWGGGAGAGRRSWAHRGAQELEGSMPQEALSGAESDVFSWAAGRRAGCAEGRSG